MRLIDRLNFWLMQKRGKYPFEIVSAEIRILDCYVIDQEKVRKELATKMIPQIEKRMVIRCEASMMTNEYIVKGFLRLLTAHGQKGEEQCRKGSR